ncbi:MAG: GTPase HflX, partial [Steroidobacteraceae bacterium]
MFERPRTGERAVLVRLGLGAPVDPEDLEEFTQLAVSAGAEPVATLTGRRAKPDSRFFLGTGKADELRSVVEAHAADVVLVDHALSAGQERNLELHVGRRVLDRNGLILDIFAQRARSAEGKLEVELAQLKHIASRLVRGWTHLERQKGGIGLRGPGETQLETDRRLVAQRVRVLSKRLEKLKQRRETGRRARAEIPVPSLALVGYTNAGKSTLFRGLTGTDAYVADQLFATLDP